MRCHGFKERNIGRRLEREKEEEEEEDGMNEQRWKKKISDTFNRSRKRTEERKKRGTPSLAKPNLVSMRERKERKERKKKKDTQKRCFGYE